MELNKASVKVAYFKLHKLQIFNLKLLFSFHAYSNGIKYHKPEVNVLQHKLQQSHEDAFSDTVRISHGDE